MCNRLYLAFPPQHVPIWESSMLYIVAATYFTNEAYCELHEHTTDRIVIPLLMDN